jgi:amino acid adenylation domain-containing protein
MTDPDLADRVTALTPTQRRTLHRLHQEQRLAQGPVRARLSVFQRGMWFLEQLHPGNPAYVVPTAARIQGRLDPARLQSALDGVIARHDALRTTFATHDGEPVQIVHPAMTVVVHDVDLTGSTDDPADLAAGYATAQALDLERGPLLHAAVLHLGPDDAILVVTIHHLVSDRWSVSVLLDELRRLYEGDSTDPLGVLGAPPLQYPDFAEWQYTQLGGERWAAAMEHWRTVLEDAPPALDLPTDRPRPAVQGFSGDQVAMTLDEALVRDVAATAGRFGATSYMVMLAAYVALWRLHTRQDTIVVAVPATVRRPELERTVGYFVNTLPVRLDLADGVTFAELVRQVHDSVMDARSREEVPFDLVVAELGAAPDLSRSPVCQVSFSYGRDPAVRLPFGGATLTRLPVSGGGARFDVELQGFESDGRFTGWWEYDAALFTPAHVEQLSGHFQHLLAHAVAHPDTPVDELHAVQPAESAAFLARINDTTTDWPPSSGWIHEQIAAQAERTPDSVAVSFEGATLTYRQLDARTNQLAHLLLQRGLRPNRTVGVCMERSLDLVVTLVAVLKAGGAFLPLDPGCPTKRLENMLGQARPLAVVVDGGATELPDGTPVIDLADPNLLTDESEAAPDVHLDGDDLAYVLFTSGSTGAPKGVMITHAGIRNRLLWMQDTFPLSGADAVLQKTAMTFDVSVWEFFWPLMTGARLVVASPGVHRDPVVLHRIITAESVTVCHFVPAMLQAFLGQPIEELDSLRLVFCSGEELPAALVNQFCARSTSALHNLYGPTEAAVDVTHWACHRLAAGHRVPIGRPIANTSVRVCNARGLDVPPGVVGELWLGGVQVAAGYLGRPELTAERFRPPPAGSGATERQFRTGDLARFRTDGDLEFLGRVDRQVKLRGQRIEPGEIEAVLLEHPAVSAAIVHVVDILPGRSQLVAHLVTDGPVPTEEVRAHAARFLPGYMVPALMVILDALPLTSSGKVDRSRLPVPPPAPARRPSLAPRTGLQSQLAEIWSDLLGVEQIGIDDNFFDLGGHSMLIIAAQTRVTAELGFDVSVVDLFQYPTVTTLARHLAGDTDRSTTPGDRAALRRERRSMHIRRTRGAPATVPYLPEDTR